MYINQMHNGCGTIAFLISNWFGSVLKKPLIHKGESLSEKKFEEIFFIIHYYFTGGELKLTDSLLFTQGYNHLSGLLKEPGINQFFPSLS